MRALEPSRLGPWRARRACIEELARLGSARLAGPQLGEHDGRYCPPAGPPAARARPVRSVCRARRHHLAHRPSVVQLAPPTCEALRTRRRPRPARRRHLSEKRSPIASATSLASSFARRRRAAGRGLAGAGRWRHRPPACWWWCRPAGGGAILGRRLGGIACGAQPTQLLDEPRSEEAKFGQLTLSAAQRRSSATAAVASPAAAASAASPSAAWPPPPRRTRCLWAGRRRCPHAMERVERTKVSRAGAVPRRREPDSASAQSARLHAKRVAAVDEDLSALPGLG